MATNNFEVDDELRVVYGYGYGGVSPFFEHLTDTTPSLYISSCRACELDYCPPRIHCQVCWGATEWREHDGSGTIESVVWAYWIPIDSPARAYTDLPYAYAAVRVDGCRNLLRTRVVGLSQQASLAELTGRRGHVRVIESASGRPGDLYLAVETETPAPAKSVK
jgi:uncharacterized OB-fold protein